MKKKPFPDNQFTFYQNPDGSVNIEVMYAHENIWLSQKRMAELFEKHSYQYIYGPDIAPDTESPPSGGRGAIKT